MLRPTIYIPSRLTSLLARARVAAVERRSPPERPPPEASLASVEERGGGSTPRSEPEDLELQPVSRCRRLAHAPLELDS